MVSRALEEWGIQDPTAVWSTTGDALSQEQDLVQLAMNDMIDGKITRLDVWDVIQSRAQLGSGVAGFDGVPPEVWR